MFLSCSMIMNFPWLLKSWLCLLKCLQAAIALGFLTFSLWLLSLIVKLCFWFINVLNVASKAFQYVNNCTTFMVDFMVDSKHFVALITFEYCSGYWGYLLNGVSDLPTYWLLQIKHSSRQIMKLLLRLTLW